LICVDNFCVSGGNNILEVEPNDEIPQDLGILSPGSYNVEGNCSLASNDAGAYNGDYDYYQIQISQAATVTISLDWAAADGDYDVILFDDTGTQVAESWQAGTVRPEVIADFAIPAVTSYYIFVTGYEGSAGDYTLTIDF
jgi:hypothetical protein